MKREAFALIVLFLSIICDAGNVIAGKDFVCKKGDGVAIYLSERPHEVVGTAIGILASDLRTVLDAPVKTVDKEAEASIIVNISDNGEVGPQGFSFLINHNGQIYIHASDSHGAAYGLLEISRQIGVSPWNWWADVTPEKRDSVVISAGLCLKASPSVKYRGIFINDEDWGLMPWSCMTNEPSDKGIIGPETTSRIFELLLRLRANTYWPPMHECTKPFFLTEGNREMAKKYGIHIGGSHCEPMGCNIAGEWPIRGEGEYDYTVNSDFIKSFWASRVGETRDQEMIFTLGMRGVHDGAMQGVKNNADRKNLLQRIIADQRKILQDSIDRENTEIPQVFIPYKEVLDVYNSGLEIPDDVTLMWCDDNYGYIRHFPDSIENKRKGGNGLYYHVSYWGRPHDYLWLGTCSLGLLFQQLNLAYDKGIREIWILNVGDIKPSEYQIELFMDMAWNIDDVKHKGVYGHMRDFFGREFGYQHAAELADIMSEHYRLSFIRKPEFMGGTRCEEHGKDDYRTIRDLPYSEAKCLDRIKQYQTLSDRVGRMDDNVPYHLKDAFFQLVRYPVQASTQMNHKLLYAQLARHGKCEWRLSHAAYDSISTLTEMYNTGIHNAGKWNHIMDFKPRKQPVFERVEEAVTAKDLPVDTLPLLTFDLECISGLAEPCEMLGYENKAVCIRGRSILAFDIKDKTDIRLEFAMIPTHPVSGEKISFDVEIDGRYAGNVEYHTKGRSEEWKENVLNNRARRSLCYDGLSEGHHELSLIPLSEGILIDDICIVAK